MIIDAHTHILGPRSSFPRGYPGLGPDFDLGAEALLRDYMDPAGIDQAVLLPMETRDSFANGRHLMQQDVLEAAAAHPDRFIPFASVDATAPDRTELLRHRVDQGCRGVGEIKYTDFHHPGHYALFEVCAAAGLPVLGHVDPDMAYLEQVLTDFPSVNFIAHGIEFWRNIDEKADKNQDYPAGPVQKANPVTRIFDRYPNLYADLSANSGLNALTRDPEFGAFLLKTHASRLIYGTDWPCLRTQTLPPERFGEDRRHLDWLEKILGGTPEHADVLSKNLLRILP